jgi:hypothetical protein
MSYWCSGPHTSSPAGNPATVLGSAHPGARMPDAVVQHMDDAQHLFQSKPLPAQVSNLNTGELIDCLQGQLSNNHDLITVIVQV